MKSEAEKLLGIPEGFLNIPYEERAQIYTLRVFHKWTNNKWKERERAGWMPIVQWNKEADEDRIKGYSRDSCDTNGAN